MANNQLCKGDKSKKDSKWSCVKVDWLKVK